MAAAEEEDEVIVSAGFGVDSTDETQDFRFLTSFASSESSKIPRRGEKDFEPNATALQQSTLEAARSAMHAVLSVERVSSGKAHVEAVYDAQTGTALVQHVKGQHFRTMGRQRGAEVRLLPEEALYLLERGSLDVKWPVVATSGDATTGDATTGDASDQEDHPLHSQQHRQSHQQPEPQPQPQPRHKVSMSLQAAYAAFITANEDVGLPHHLKLDEYTVYAGLKRAGYIVLRTGSHQHDAPPSSASRPVLPGSQSAGAGPSALAALFLTVWKRLFAPMVGGAGIDFVNGPLVKPGLYRSYGEIYRRLGQLIPDSAAEQLARAVPEPDAPLRLTFDVYRPSAAFRKSAPGPPDFRVCVVDARSTAVPTMAQLDHLLGQAPWEPPREDSQLYQRLKHGYRNVLLAVVDQGIVSYLRFAETAFSTQPIYQYRGKGARGGKKGGYRRQRGGRR